MTDQGDMRRPGLREAHKRAIENIPLDATLSGMPDRPPKNSRAAEVQVTRRRRQGMGPERNLKLHIPEESKDPDMEYRWVNDRPGRIRNLTERDDYAVVSTSELKEGDPDPDRATGEGTVMARSGDKYTGERMVLLKKSKKFYDQDKAEERKADEDRLAVLRRGALPSSDGLSDRDGAYVPGKRNVILGK